MTLFYPIREEIEKQKAKERYMKMHLAGKTEQAKADLARLAIIRKQREEAARKKEEERKGKPGRCGGPTPVPERECVCVCVCAQACLPDGGGMPGLREASGCTYLRG